MGLRSSIGELVDQPLDASVPEAHDVEVEEEPEVKARQLEVGQHLGIVDGRELSDRLDLDEDRALDQQVDPVPCIDQYVVVAHRELLLSLDSEPTPPKLMFQAGFIRRLEEPWSQGGVDVEGRPQDALRQVVEGGHVGPVFVFAYHCLSAVESRPISPSMASGDQTLPISARRPAHVSNDQPGTDTEPTGSVSEPHPSRAPRYSLRDRAPNPERAHYGSAGPTPAARFVKPHPLCAVKAELLPSFGERLDPLLAAAMSGELTARTAEIRTWELVVSLGRALLTVLLTLLRDCATRDSKSARPIVYASTDAHALKRFVDETWDPKWKMTNGIRLWCIARDTGRIIHLGGEYTWGDCQEVRRRFERLQTTGHLPVDDDYGDGVIAQVALLTDGLDWISGYILPLFPTAELVLDPYHVVEQVAEAASKAFPNNKAKAPDRTGPQGAWHPEPSRQDEAPEGAEPCPAQQAEVPLRRERAPPAR
jgi:hypothetical protein